jgi:hypothetical protein
MEKIPCGSGGTGAMAISCDLTAENKDMVLVIADLRDSTQVMRSINELVKNRKSPAKLRSPRHQTRNETATPRSCGAGHAALLEQIALKKARSST